MSSLKYRDNGGKQMEKFMDVLKKQTKKVLACVKAVRLMAV